MKALDYILARFAARPSKREQEIYEHYCWLDSVDRSARQHIDLWSWPEDNVRDSIGAWKRFWMERGGLPQPVPFNQLLKRHSYSDALHARDRYECFMKAWDAAKVQDEAYYRTASAIGPLEVVQRVKLFGEAEAEERAIRESKRRARPMEDYWHSVFSQADMGPARVADMPTEEMRRALRRVREEQGMRLQR